MDDDAWSKDIAALMADALVDGGVLERAAVERASEIIAEEIWTRLLLGDYPPGASDSSKRVTVKPAGPNPIAG